MIAKCCIVVLLLILIGNDTYAQVKISALSARPFSSLQNTGREIVPLKKEVKRLDFIPRMKEKRKEPIPFSWERLRTHKQQDIVPLVSTITHRQIPTPKQKLPVVKKQMIKEKMVDLEILYKKASCVIEKSGIDPAKEQLRKARVFIRLVKDAETCQLALNYIERAQALVNSALEITTLKVIQ